MQTDSAKKIPSTGFFTDPTTPCATIRNLVDNVDVDTTIVSIAYGASVSADVKLCLDKLQVSANTPSGTYSTTFAGGIAWDIDTTPCTDPGCI